MADGASHEVAGQIAINAQAARFLRYLGEHPGLLPTFHGPADACAADQMPALFRHLPQGTLLIYPDYLVFLTDFVSAASAAASAPAREVVTSDELLALARLVGLGRLADRLNNPHSIFLHRDAPADQVTSVTTLSVRRRRLDGAFLLDLVKDRLSGYVNSAAPGRSAARRRVLIAGDHALSGLVGALLWSTGRAKVGASLGVVALALLATPLFLGGGPAHCGTCTAVVPTPTVTLTPPPDPTPTATPTLTPGPGTPTAAPTQPVVPPSNPTATAAPPTATSAPPTAIPTPPIVTGGWTGSRTPTGAAQQAPLVISINSEDPGGTITGTISLPGIYAAGTTFQGTVYSDNAIALTVNGDVYNGTVNGNTIDNGTFSGGGTSGTWVANH